MSTTAASQNKHLKNLNVQDHGVCKADNSVREPISLDWDCSLHLPLWVSAVEKASIEERLDEWTRQLEDSGADIASIEVCSLAGYTSLGKASGRQQLMQ
ncbi:hypothetical protein Droror1_Dr00023750 [Drosera rotundifolia]